MKSLLSMAGQAKTGIWSKKQMTGRFLATSDGKFYCFMCIIGLGSCLFNSSVDYLLSVLPDIAS